MITLRIISMIAWLVLFANMAPAVWSIITGKPRTGDPVRLVFAAFSVVVVGFNLRWLLIPESIAVQAALHVLSAGTAVYAIITARSYGRGDHV